MQLHTIWFIIIAILWVGFFVLEGFDFGVGALHPFIGRSETERRVEINTIGPWWDGKIAAMPGRRTPGRNILAWAPANRAEATIAPVLPAETIALTSPAAIMPQLLEIELSRFLRRASTGFSSMPIDWLAWTIGRRSRGAAGALASSASIRS